MADLIVGMMREELFRSSRTRVGGWLAKPAFLNFQRRTDYAEFGAVPLLGVEGGLLHRPRPLERQGDPQRHPQRRGVLRRRPARRDPRQGRGAAARERSAGAAGAEAK
jgi:hypothetical protein